MAEDLSGLMHGGPIEPEDVTTERTALPAPRKCEGDGCRVPLNPMNRRSPTVWSEKETDAEGKTKKTKHSKFLCGGCRRKLERRLGYSIAMKSANAKATKAEKGKNKKQADAEDSEGEQEAEASAAFA